MKSISLFTFDALNDEMARFLQHYEIEKMIFCPDSKMKNLKLKQDRVCRFCGISNAPEKFRHDSHIIPHLLGNRYLLSDFECDDCNEFFSAYENDLANSLGVIRTLSKTKAKENIPGFKSPSKLKAKINGNFYGSQTIEISDDDGKFISSNFDPHTGTTKFIFSKNPYKPLSVFKVLLKIALSIIPEGVVPNYSRGFDFLRNGKYEEMANEFAKVLHYTIPFESRFKKPMAILFRKKNATDSRPTHVFALYYSNMVYEFPLVFNNVDIASGIFKTESTADIITCPPILPVLPNENSVFEQRILAFGSNEVLQNELQYISFSVNPEELKKMICFDPKTGIISKDIPLGDDLLASILWMQIPSLISKKQINEERGVETTKDI